MLDKIKNFFSVGGKKPSNSILFWNAMYYVILGIGALINIELFQILYGLSSIFAIGVLFDDGSYDNHFWVLTSLPFLFILLIGACVFIIFYPINKFITWFNSIINGENCIKHDYKRITKTPDMINDENYCCSFTVQYKCGKCNKTKERSSDMYLGMRIINLDEDEKN